MEADLKERFSSADDLGTPDLWAEARRRSATPEPLERAFEWPPSAARRLAVGALAFAVFATAVIFAWDVLRGHSGPEPRPRPRRIASSVDLTAEFGAGWTQLPGPQEVSYGSATAWTGSQLIVWGGSADDHVVADGYAFDVGAREWLSIPDGPLSARSHAASAWTGRELVIWGGRTDECCVSSEMFLDDGAAYDPESRTWRTLPAAPIEARAPFSVWTGHELLVWGSQDRALRYLDGAAYDPATDTWRRIADGPIEITDGTAVWTGTEMVVFGAALHGGNVPESETAIGASYDPRTDSWQELPPSLGIDPNANTAVWARDRLIAVDFDSDAEAFDPAIGRWSKLPHMPLREGEDVPEAASIGDSMVVTFFGQIAVFSTTTRRWTDATDEVPHGYFAVGPPAVAGGAFLLLARSYDLSDRPNVEFDTRLFAYVPPIPNATPSVINPAPFVPDTRTVGHVVRMPLVFPDGSRVTLAYPEELGLAELGIQPDVSYLWSVDPGPRFPIVFLHDPEASIAEYVQGTEPVTTIDDPRGQVEIWGMAPRWESRRDLLQGSWLRYRLDSWTVLVASTTTHAYGVADYLRVRQTDDGFPVVDVVGPIELATGYGESEGPILGIADAFPDPDETPIGAAIFLSLEGCSGPSEVVAPPGGYGSDCLAQGNVFAGIYGNARFVAAVIEHVRAEDFHVT